MTREDPQLKLRISAEMRDRIAELAKQNGRSMNAEIVSRLEWALSLTGPPKLVDSANVQQPVAGALSWLITNEIKDLADRAVVPFDEMFAKIVLAGLHPDAPQVLYSPVMPGASKESVRAALEASRDVARVDATRMLENLERAPWAPEWMVERLQAALPKQDKETSSQPGPKTAKRVARTTPSKKTA